MSGELKKASVGGKFFGSILLFLVFAVIFLVASWFSPAWHYFFPSEKDLDAKRGEARIEKRHALEKQNQPKLTTYAWVDKDKGIVQIPIERAMTVVAPELAEKKVNASAVKVENPYPYGLQDVPAPAATGTAAPAASGTAAPAAPGTTTSGSAAPTATGSATTAPAAPPAHGQ